MTYYVYDTHTGKAVTKVTLKIKYARQILAKKRKLPNGYKYAIGQKKSL